ncbi:MAG: YidC/Oxa1 family membrane protein insertase [Treponema sp.]|nr:YidC/Oxa1 family membrane protein insertase [Treponema sp.]
MANFFYNLIIYPLYQIIEVVYLVVWKVFKNSGYAVIGISIAVTFLCLPLYIIAEKWQQVERDKQKEMKSGIDRIKSVFKGDEQYMILSTFYKQHHYHPLMALRSSISLLIQIPFFMAAYKYLSELEELRGFSFYFIKDMGAPDAMFHIGSFPINVLPIAMTLINILAGAIYCKGLGWKEKGPIYGMALLFLVILYNSPAGLVLYWTMNNIFSLVKNIFYKMKNPLKVLYGCLCVAVLFIDYFLLFKHTGFMHRRIMLMCVVSVILFIPLLLKLINYLLNKPFSSLMNNTKACNVLYFISITTLSILLGIYLPSNVIAASPAEFSFIGNHTTPYYLIVDSTAKIMGLLFCWCTAIYFLFGKKIKTIFALLFSVITLSALINCFIFAGDYGLLSPILNFDSPASLKATGKLNIINLLVLLIPFIVVGLLIYFNKTKVLNYGIIFISFALIAISFVNVFKIQKVYKETKGIMENNSSNITEIKPIFHLSKTNKNVLIFMLDRGISAFVPEILNEKPELKDKFSGFTFYPNTASFGRNTLFGSPAMFGGYDYTPLEMNKRDSEPLVKKHNEALLLVPTLFKENGYDVTVTDSSWANFQWVPDLSIYDGTGINAYRTITEYTDLWLDEHPELIGTNLKETLMQRNFIWYSLLKTMPTVFRDTIYNDGFYWNTNKSSKDLQATVNNYAVLDYLPRLTDFSATENTYTYIVNELTHEPAFMQAPDYVPSTNITNYGEGPYSKDVDYHANICALNKLGILFDYLKENNVYDNTRIIIVSDHAFGVSTTLFSEKYPIDAVTFNPLLFVKDFNSSGQLKISDEFMTNADVPALSVDGLISDPINKNTGNLISSLPKENGIIIGNAYTWSPDDQNKNTFKIDDNQWYHLKNDIHNADNWKQISYEQAMAGDY